MNLKINNLNKKYDDFTLDNINFEINNGSIMGFIGANGAGKSTTIKAIMNLIKKDSGEILFDNKILDKNIKEKIGIVFDETYFPNTMNGIGINNLYKKMYKNHNEKKFFDLLKEFEIDNNKIIEKYSKGMKMKLNIALALSHNPELLILDEATTGLDPIIRNRILDIFSDFVSNNKNSILISSHIVSDLERLCDTITYIDKGKILFSNKKDKLLNEYKCIELKSEDILYSELKKFKYHKIRDIYYFLIPNKLIEQENLKKIIKNDDIIVRPTTIEDIILITGGYLND